MNAELAWYPICVIELQSELSISDTALGHFHTEAVVVPVPKGQYCVEARYASHQQERYVSAVRVRSVAVAEEVSRGREIGRVTIDFNQIGFCDRRALLGAFTQMPNDTDVARYSDALCNPNLAFAVTLPCGTTMAVVRSHSFGDAVFAVHELIGRHGGVAGAEVDCESDRREAEEA